MSKLTLEEYIEQNDEFDVVELKKAYKFTDSDIETALFNARRAGIPVVRTGDKIKRILNKKEFDMALYEEFLERQGKRVNGIEYR